MRETKAPRRNLLIVVLGYTALSALCAALSEVTRFPPAIDAVAAAVVPYAFFLLGPPVTLVAGRPAVPLYVVETAILAALAWTALRASRRSAEACGLVLLVTAVFWIACGLSAVVFAI
jgi:hypothetical protein